MISPGKRAVNESPENDSDPLLDRVNALLQRHHQPLRAPDDDVPVLTEVVAADRRDIIAPEASGTEALNPAAVAALVARMKRAVLDGIEPKIQQLFADRMAPILSGALDEALSQARAELTGEIHRIVHDAVTSAVAGMLEPGTRHESS